MQKLYAIFIILLFVSCKQEDLTPSFIKIDSIELNTDGPTQGENSHAIVDAWVYVDNAPIGVFETPCVVPILEEGEHQLVIYPGIKNNGISATRIRYPFYERWESTVNLVKDDTLHLNPVVTYKSDVEMALLEDFEDAGIDFVSYGESDTSIQFVTDPGIVKYGSKCGGVWLNSEDTVMLVKTISNLNLERNEECYLEIDYKNDNTFGCGVISYEGIVQLDQPILYIWNAQTSATTEWKKIYIDLKEDVSTAINSTSYGLYFLSALDSGKTAANVYVDNIKVVKYQ